MKAKKPDPSAKSEPVADVGAKQTASPTAPASGMRITPEMLAAKAPVAIAAHVVQRIHRHARSSMNAEICGVLIGEETDGVTAVEAAIEGEGASQGGAHVTFTQDAWEHIYSVKDKEYPEKRIVGWYHSHPGFGIFLSQHDLFIHENFFSSPAQIAWVYDPHSDEEGCFGWVNGKVKRLSEVRILELGAEDAPVLGEEPNEIPEAEDEEHTRMRAGEKPEAKPPATRWRNRLLVLLALLVMFVAGLAAGIFLYPRSFIMYEFPNGRVLTEAEMRQALEREAEYRQQLREKQQNTPAEKPGNPPTNRGDSSQAPK